MKRLTLVLALLAAFSFGVKAQDFTPYPYIQLQGGAAYDFGNADFAKLISPAAQIAVGYQFVDCWSLRFAVNGWQGKHTSWQTESLYSYKYIHYLAKILHKIEKRFLRFARNDSQLSFSAAIIASATASEAPVPPSFSRTSA